MAYTAEPTTTSTASTVGVVIVSYNTSDMLHTCLQSLTCCTLPLRIVVVDNASSDDSVARVRTHFPHVTLSAQEYNHGFAAATNIGIRMLCDKQHTHHPPPVLLLLNPDTIVHPGAIETLIQFLHQHPRVALAAPRLLNPDGSVQHAAFRFPTLMMSVLDVFPPGEVLPGRLYGSWWHGRYPQEQDGTAPFPIDHPLGACMLVRREIIEQVGLLDECYFMYSEEIAWCWRIRQARWAIWQVPQARVTHVGGGSTQQFRHRMFVALHQSRVRFFRQHYSQRFVQLHRCITQAGMLRAVLLAWNDYRRGQASTNEIRARLWAYGEVSRL